MGKGCLPCAVRAGNNIEMWSLGSDEPSTSAYAEVSEGSLTHPVRWVRLKRLTEKFSQLLFNDSTIVLLGNLPNHSFNYLYIRCAFSNPHSASGYANLFIDDPSFLQVLHEGPLGIQTASKNAPCATTPLLSSFSYNFMNVPEDHLTFNLRQFAANFQSAGKHVI